MPDSGNSPIDLARRLNARYLGQQTRRSGEPTVEHCHRVEQRFAKLAAGHLTAEEIMEGRCAAELHDAVEDAANWNDPEALARVRAEIQTQLGIAVLGLVEDVTVDPRLSIPERAGVFLERVVQWSLRACLVKWADLEDNAPTRDRLGATPRAEWEAYATVMLCERIPERLYAFSWQGELPPLTLPACLK